MKFGWLVDFRINEIEGFCWASIILGTGIFALAACWDMIAGYLKLHHSSGYGWEQIVVMAASGLYVFWGYCIAQDWKE